jgi:cell wall-associated NlpC family hydrolase
VDQRRRLSRVGAAVAAALVVPVGLVGVEALAGLKPTPPVEASDVARTAVEVATQQVGKPWAWGAKGPSAFDASGLLTFSYDRAGLRLPHGSFHQYRTLTTVEQRSDAVPGDLVFFNDGNCGRVSSVAIVISKNEVVRASGTAGRVIRARLH